LFLDGKLIGIIRTFNLDKTKEIHQHNHWWISFYFYWAL